MEVSHVLNKSVNYSTQYCLPALFFREARKGLANLQWQHTSPRGLINFFNRRATALHKQAKLFELFFKTETFLKMVKPDGKDVLTAG